MTSSYRFLSPRYWKDYELLDCGNFEKLERFGAFILWRPEPQAIWDKQLSQKEWDSLWNAKYVREKGRDDILLTTEKGNWTKKTGMKDRWMIGYSSTQLDLKFNLSLTAFGHIGIFPEQAENWEFIYESVKSLDAEKPKVLNLFAYSGGSSLAACAAGAEVVHLDSVKQAVTWANENKQASGLNGVIRWLVEDAMKFVKREERRGSRYHGIILDPPAYGRGPEGEKWLLSKHLNEMVSICNHLLHPTHHFFLLNIYSIGFSAVILDTLLNTHFGKAKREIGELIVCSKTGMQLPLGTWARFRT
ncbi:MAG TPA: class I SAM-dependent methyltransferase [Chitinophagales bacterium]|nr:class I SAM-dependent methyltransferase [Chitinophagales bacterium]